MLDGLAAGEKGGAGMTEQDRELIRALRCAATQMTGDEPCKTCRYNKKEEWNGHEWESCDVDRISMDAAARLEETTGGETND